METVALALLIWSGAMVLYTYYGYSKILQWLATRQQPTKPLSLKDSDLPNLTVLICAHNEAAQIIRKLDNCFELDYPSNKIRVLVVSDGSSDATNRKVQDYPDQRVSLLVAPRRQGKAACINLGFQQISDDFVLMLDARQMLSANAARDLICHFSDPTVGAVTGKLVLELTEGPGSGRNYDKGVSNYWSHEVRLRQTEATVHSVIGVTGAIYALRREAFRPIPSGTILDDVLIPMNAILEGYRVRFAAEALAFDKASNDPQQEQRRKIRTLAGNFQLLCLRPELLNWRKNPVFWMFLSHKVLRLLIPIAMLTALICALALYNVNFLFALMFWGQVLAYLTSVIPEHLFKSFAFWPLRIVRTFVQMHWYVVMGFFEFVLNKNVHIWVVSGTRGAEPPN